MEILARYPIDEAGISSYVGRTVGVFTAHGDFECGVFERCHDGHIVLRPLTGEATAVTQSMRKSIKSHPRINASVQKARTKALGLGYGRYPYGWGYGNFGWGLGWWWTLPLFALAAIVSFPFWI